MSVADQILKWISKWTLIGQVDQLQKPQVWMEACTHQSCKLGYDYTRMKYIGDIHLGTSVGTYVYRRFAHLPKVNEAFLSTIRSNVIKRDHLTNELALRLDVKSLVIVPSTFNTINPTIIEDVFEALIGAMWMEFGTKVVDQVIWRWMDEFIDWSELIAVDRNYKQRLLQMIQSQLGVSPEWRQNGRRTELWLSGKLIGTGVGRLRINAQQMACQQALESLLANGTLVESIRPTIKGVGNVTLVGESYWDADIDECVFVHPTANLEINYEKLEYLGDLQLEREVCLYLIERFPNQTPAFWTILKTKLVRTETLATHARRLGFERYIIRPNNLAVDDNLLEDIMEAYLGSMFNRGHLERMQHEIYDMLDNYTDWAKLISLDENYKQQLLVFFQSFSSYQPINVVEDIIDGIYTVALLDAQGFVICRGKHKDRQLAEQMAAQTALSYLIKSCPKPVRLKVPTKNRTK